MVESDLTQRTDRSWERRLGYALVLSWKHHECVQGKKKKMKALSKSHRYGDKEKRSDIGVEMGWGRGAR